VTKAELRQIVAEVLEIEPSELSADTDLFSIDTFDSVTVLSLMIRLDERAGIKLEPKDVQNLSRYGDFETIAVRQGIDLIA
jgi:acyl carrier protein